MKQLDEFKTWFRSLEKRERNILSIGAAFVAATVLYAGILHPYLQSRATLRATINDKQALLAWMKPAAAQIETLSQQQPSGLPAGQSLLAVVNGSAGTAGFGDSLKNVQSANDGSVRVQFQGVSFDNLVRWLGQLQRQYAIQVTAMTAQKGTAGGTVDATLTLEAPVS